MEKLLKEFVDRKDALEEFPIHSTDRELAEEDFLCWIDDIFYPAIQEFLS